MNSKWVSFSPHIQSKNSTTKTYLLMILALCPVLASAVVMTNFNALWVVVCSIISAVSMDVVFKLVVDGKYDHTELSAIMIGLIIGLALPTGTYPPVVILPTMFTILFIRNLSGGIGQNFVSEIAVAVVLTYLIFPHVTNAYFAPQAEGYLFSTPLMDLLAGKSVKLEVVDLLFGGVAGTIAETACFWLILAGLVLMIFKVIDFRVPAVVLVSTFVFSILFFDLESAIIILLSGGILLSAFFIATDYAIIPKNKVMKYVYGLLIGFLTVIILKYAKNPLAIFYAIMIVGLISSGFSNVFKLKRRSR